MMHELKVPPMELRGIGISMHKLNTDSSAQEKSASNNIKKFFQPAVKSIDSIPADLSVDKSADGKPTHNAKDQDTMVLSSEEDEDNLKGTV